MATVLFMTICFCFIWHGRLIPDSMIYSYFSAIGAEGFIMGWIKSTKIKERTDNTDGDGN